MVLSQAKRRVNEQLVEYWKKLSAGRPFPLENEVDPTALSDIWDSCFLVRHEPDAEELEFRYMYLGEALVEAYGDEFNEKEVCQKLAYPQNNELAQQFFDVVQTKAPVRRESEFTNSKGLIIKYRSVMLPLAKDDPDTVGYVIGAMRWKAV